LPKSSALGFGNHDLGQHPMQIEQRPVEISADEARLRARQAAVFLNISDPTLRAWRSQGIGPPWSRVGPKLVVYKLGDLREYAAASNTAAA
jgi:hypothetical protein